MTALETERMPLRTRRRPEGERWVGGLGVTGATAVAAAVGAVRPAGIVLVGAVLIAVASPTEAQWSVERSPGNAVARAVGLDGRVHVAVGCQESSQVVTLRMPGGAAFSGGSVETQWDDGSTERYRLQEEEGILRASSMSPQIRSLIGKLGQRRTVRILGINARGEEVTDRISLTGSSRAIGALPCSSSARPSAGRPSGRSDAEIRRILVRQSISRYSGSCPCPYNTDRAGRRCGRRSAYSRPGGASPPCYPGDVSDRAVEAYRARTKR